MKGNRLTAAESHELATRVSTLGAKQVLQLLRDLQNHSFDTRRFSNDKHTPNTATH